MTPIACNCPTCRRMCESSTCLPTPDEALALVARGLGHRLATFAFEPDPAKYRCVGPAPAGQEGARDLSHTRSGPCTFYRDGGCELHDSGKPLEGRLAHHDRPWLPIRMQVLGEWKPKLYSATVSVLN